MRRIEFLWIIIENYGSFVGKHMFQYSDLEPGIYLVQGRNKLNPRLAGNGAGKSTFLNAIAWCLTGQTVNKLRAPDLKPRKLDKATTRVELGVLIDGTKRVFCRTARPNLLTLDGEECAQETVDQLMLPLPVLGQTLLLGQDEDLFPDLGNTAKMNLLSEVMDWDRWELRSKRAQKRVDELSERINTVETRIVSNRAIRTKYKELIELNTSLMKDWSKDQKGKIQKLSWEVKEHEQLLVVHTKQYTDADIEAAACYKAIEEAEMDVKEARDLLHDFDNKNQGVVLEREMLKREIDRKTKELEDLREAKVCPTCKQPIKKGDSHEHQELLEQQIEEAKAKRKKLKVDDVGRLKLAAALKKVEDRVAELRKTYGTLNKATDQLFRLKTQSESHIKAAKQSIKRLEEEVNPHKSQVAKLREKRKELRVKIKEDEAERDKLQRLAERAKFWVKGFKDIRLLLIEELLMELEITTNALLDDMGLVGWVMNFAMERETKSGTVQTGISVTILEPGMTEPVKWETWSGGEKQRLRVASAMALSEVLLNHAGISIDLEILDEPTVYFSDQGVTDLVDTLAERARLLQRKILYVDHQVTESSQFAGTIRVTRTKEGSKISMM